MLVRCHQLQFRRKTMYSTGQRQENWIINKLFTLCQLGATFHWLHIRAVPLSDFLVGVWCRRFPSTQFSNFRLFKDASSSMNKLQATSRGIWFLSKTSVQLSRVLWQRSLWIVWFVQMVASAPVAHDCNVRGSSGCPGDWHRERQWTISLVILSVRIAAVTNNIGSPSTKVQEHQLLRKILSCNMGFLHTGLAHWKRNSRRLCHSIQDE
jgi:hypothetical protein